MNEISRTADSGGECGVLAETMYYTPTENRGNYWYSTDYDLFWFCIADSEHDWREGTDQYKFIENCLATVDRKKQPWLIFIAHRVLAKDGSFAEPMSRESVEKLWQKYTLDIAFYGHVHKYERRTCLVYEVRAAAAYHISREDHYLLSRMHGDADKKCYAGRMHELGEVSLLRDHERHHPYVVVGGGGSHLSNFTTEAPAWSIYREMDYGFVKLTAFNYSSLLYENKRCSYGKVYDSFTVHREYRDVLACVKDSCPPPTPAT
ncbi:hypothetical protein EJB05_44467, partial [Eragrostis curvula]